MLAFSVYYPNQDSAKSEREMHKKKKKISADESFEYGPLKMMRFGKLNLLQNRMNSEQHTEFINKLADQHPKNCQEIDEIVQRIADSVASFCPLPLLHRAYWEYLPSNMGIASEVEVGQEAMEKRFILFPAVDTSETAAKVDSH